MVEAEGAGATCCSRAAARASPTSWRRSSASTPASRRAPTRTTWPPSSRASSRRASARARRVRAGAVRPPCASADAIAPAARVALVGLAKNTGKTVTLGASCASWRQRGEPSASPRSAATARSTTRSTTRIAKPRDPPAGEALVATTEPLLQRSGVAHEVRRAHRHAHAARRASSSRGCWSAARSRSPGRPPRRTSRAVGRGDAAARRRAGARRRRDRPPRGRLAAARRRRRDVDRARC